MISNKLYEIHELVKISDSLKNQNKVIGFTNGCFDLLHEGHIQLLYEASKLCNFLIVGLNSDLSIKKLKGTNRPIDSETTRVHNLNSRNEVNAIITFENQTPLTIIKKIMPHIIFKGSDYKDKKIIGAKEIKKNNGKVHLISNLEGYSTTSIIEKLKL
jgi:D-beta-D-heptose 7-phosphate kinase/D-beta-D-heptose 1-phosphate adenosyltransferase